MIDVRRRRISWNVYLSREQCRDWNRVQIEQNVSIEQKQKLQKSDGELCSGSTSGAYSSPHLRCCTPPVVGGVARKTMKTRERHKSSERITRRADKQTTPSNGKFHKPLSGSAMRSGHSAKLSSRFGRSGHAYQPVAKPRRLGPGKTLLTPKTCFFYPCFT